MSKPTKEWAVVHHTVSGIRACIVETLSLQESKNLGEIITAFAQKNMSVSREEFLTVAHMDVYPCRTTIEADLASVRAASSESKTKLSLSHQRQKIVANARSLVEPLDSPDFKVSTGLDVAATVIANTIKTATSELDALAARQHELQRQLTIARPNTVWCVKLYASYKRDAIKCSVGPFVCLVSGETVDRAKDEARSRYPGTVDTIEYIYAVEPDSMTIPREFVTQWNTARDVEMALRKKERLRLLEQQMAAAKKEMGDLQAQ